MPERTGQNPRKPPLLAIPEYDLDTLKLLSEDAVDWNDDERVEAFRRLEDRGLARDDAEPVTDAGKVLLNYVLGCRALTAEVVKVRGERDVYKTECEWVLQQLCSYVENEDAVVFEKAGLTICRLRRVLGTAAIDGKESEHA